MDDLWFHSENYSLFPWENKSFIRHKGKQIFFLKRQPLDNAAIIKTVQLSTCVKCQNKKNKMKKITQFQTKSNISRIEMSKKLTFAVRSIDSLLLPTSL